MTADTFSTNWDTNANVFAATYADCLEGIESSDVSIDSVTDISPTAAARLRRLTSSSVSLDFTVYYDITTLGYPNDPEGAYESLLADLNTAISGTHFRKYLASNIALYSATGLDSARGGSITASSYAAEADDNPPVLVNHKKRETRYFIIGVIAGGGGFLLLAWIVIYGVHHFTKQVDETTAAANKAAASRADGFEAVKTKEVELPDAPIE